MVHQEMVNICYITQLKPSMVSMQQRKAVFVMSQKVVRTTTEAVFMAWLCKPQSCVLFLKTYSPVGRHC